MFPLAIIHDCYALSLSDFALNFMLVLYNSILRSGQEPREIFFESFVNPTIPCSHNDQCSTPKAITRYKTAASASLTRHSMQCGTGHIRLHFLFNKMLE